ncbi:MAG TPA: GNAT family N-acetyltransferase [Pyrinomonadaceae bacterium]|nr:GNAT family N-acetyltransferase [Pyrinomonadaceae bacterium]
MPKNGDAPHIRIRTAAASEGADGDAALLAELGARTFYETFVESCRPEDMRAYLDAAFGTAQQAAELADARSTFLIAETDGEDKTAVAVGYAKLFTSDETPDCVAGNAPVELARLYVLREWLGSGAGAALMRELLEAARRAGQETIWLGVWENNERAIAFYRKWGFEVVGEHIFQVGDDPQNDQLMARQLTEAGE